MKTVWHWKSVAIYLVIFIPYLLGVHLLSQWRHLDSVMALLFGLVAGLVYNEVAIKFLTLWHFEYRR